MSDEPIAALIPIEDGADAKAKPLRQNFKYLDDRITNQSTNISNKETTSNKGAANGYCGLDSNAKIPSTQKNDIVSSTVDAIYPVGSIYVTTSTSETCPIASLISGSTWIKVSEGRVLQGADSSHAPNTTIAAGLPNISGSAWNLGIGYRNYPAGFNGAFTGSSSGGDLPVQGGSDNWPGYFNGVLRFTASNSNSIYGNSSTVQPPAYVVVIWRRTA